MTPENSIARFRDREGRERERDHAELTGSGMGVSHSFPQDQSHEPQSKAHGR